MVGAGVGPVVAVVTCCISAAEVALPYRRAAVVVRSLDGVVYVASFFPLVVVVFGSLGACSFK